jgi:hypothetical protein
MSEMKMGGRRRSEMMCKKKEEKYEMMCKKKEEKHEMRCVRRKKKSIKCALI